jgi:sec-independent protein translocase protein TatB
MFDIGFSELLLFGVIALVVLGPEKLPQAARTAGHWYAKFRRTVATLQNEIEAELDLAETRQKMQEELAKIKQAEAEMKREMAELRGSMQEFENAQNKHLASTQYKPSAETTSTNTQSVHLDKSGVATAAVNANSDIVASQDPAGDQNPVANQDPATDQIFTKSDANDTATETIANAIPEAITRPWEHMWFRLSDYDKARRLPPAPLRANYHADVLLNTQQGVPKKTATGAGVTS